MENILITVSGGRTSAFMAVYMKERYKNINLLFCFANTGKEKEETLVFLKQVQEYFNIPIVWLEADIKHEKGQGTEYKIVDFETANRDGGPFTSLIEKYGLPSKMWRHCTRELKEKPIHKYATEYFGDYKTAIGIRADEPQRLSRKDGIIYPLNEINTTKQFINDWWKKQSFDLQLSESEGNCDFCFLKSKRKRINLLKNGLNVDWWKDIEEKHSDDKRPMFDVRNGLTVADLVAMAKVENLQMGIPFDYETSCFCGN